MTNQTIPVGTPVSFKAYPRLNRGRRHRGHVVQVKMPGEPGVPTAEGGPTYRIFDRTDCMVRALKREHFRVHRRKRDRRP